MNEEKRTQILKLITDVNLPVPRLESRNFVTTEIVKINASEMMTYRVQTYYILVYQELSDSIGFSLIDSSVASAVPLTNLEPGFWLGFRRSGDILNLSTQLKIPAFVVDQDNNFSELILSEKNTPQALKSKSYYKKL